MNALTALRQDLVRQLTEAGHPALDKEPARVSPPVILVSPASPYLDAAATFGARTVRLKVRIVTLTGDGAAEQLDDALLEVLPVIESATVPGTALGAAWDVAEVSEPYLLLANGATYPAIDITATTDITT